MWRHCLQQRRHPLCQPPDRIANPLTDRGITNLSRRLNRDPSTPRYCTGPRPPHNARVAITLPAMDGGDEKQFTISVDMSVGYRCNDFACALPDNSCRWIAQNLNRNRPPARQVPTALSSLDLCRQNTGDRLPLEDSLRVIPGRIRDAAALDAPVLRRVMRPVATLVLPCADSTPYCRAIAAISRSRVNGMSRSRTPSALCMAFPIAAPVGPCAPSPAPNGG